ncbi:MAG: DUF4249 family protein [Paludibacter sp.]|nr:DUF4249 family protein [Paludibacter sp.]
MFKLKKILYFLLLTCILQACDSTEIDYIKPDNVNRLAAFCFFNPDSVWSVQVSKLANVTDISSDDLLIQNALVIIKDDTEMIDTLSFIDKGIYKSINNMKPEFNKIYSLEVSCPGYETLYSTKESLPSPVVISGNTVYSFLIENTFPSETYNDTLWYKQKTVETNISVKKGQFIRVSSTERNGNIEWGIAVSLKNMNNLIAYDCLNANIFEVKENQLMKLQSAVYAKSDALNIMTISADYLLYEVSSAEYDFVVNTTRILTPNNIFSNISGGGGLFVGYTLDIISINIISKCS